MMKRIILSATLSLSTAVSIAVFGSTALAQQATTPVQQQPAATHHPRHDPHHQAVRFGRKLHLTPDQTARLEPIFADRQQKMRALRENTALSPQEKHDQMRAIRQTTHDQFAGVLTQEQLDQATAMRHEHHRGDRAPQGT